MIGVVGPADSVALIGEVAAELGRSHELIPRAYQDPREAGDLLDALRGYCDVVLFTGQVPYAIARDRAGGVDQGPALQVVPHSGADLYRVIAQVLRESGGRFPVASLDALDQGTVERVFRDLDLPVPHVFEVDDHNGDLAYTSSHDWAMAHAQAQADGTAEIALTCLASTFAVLSEQGRKVCRIEHTRVTIADALQRAFLTAELWQSRSGQVAVVLVQVTGTAGQLTLSPGRSRELMEAQSLLVETAGDLRAQLTQRDLGTYVITSTVGVVENDLLRQSARDPLAALLATSSEVRIGIGTGPTFVSAQAGADDALRATSPATPALILLPDGQLRGIDEIRSSGTQSAGRDQAVMALADQLGVGTQSLRRLLQAIRSVDTDAVTARQLSDAYGIQPRSARRLLRALTEAGYATEVGRRSGPRTGRPQTVFAVDLTGLSEALGTQA